MEIPHPNCGKTVCLTFYNSIHVPRNNSQIYFSCCGKLRKYYKNHCFMLFWWTSHQPHLKQLAETEMPHWEKTVCLIFIVASMLQEIILNLLSFFGISRTHCEKHHFSSILKNFHWSSSKIDGSNGNTISRKTVSLTFIVASISPEIIYKFTFHSVENQENTMKTTVFFQFDELQLKLTYNILQK